MKDTDLAAAAAIDFVVAIAFLSIFPLLLYQHSTSLQTSSIQIHPMMMTVPVKNESLSLNHITIVILVSALDLVDSY